jgi:restriction system protein
MASTWQECQEEVAAFFRSLGRDAITNHTAQGVRTTHDIDVYVKSHHVGFDVVWIVECKHWSTRVNKLHVLALREIVADLGADRGILLCEAGFQSGSLEAATLTNVHLSSLAALRDTASAEFAAMRARELYDRTEACRVRYWDLSKEARIAAGLRPAVPDVGYSGDHVIELASELLAKASRGNYPFILDTVRGIVIFGEIRQFTSAAEVLDVLEGMIVDLEARLAACEATLK